MKTEPNTAFRSSPWYIFTKLLILFSCAVEAKKAQYKHFWIEFYGECWASANLDFRHLTYEPKMCWGKRPNYQDCRHHEKNPVCVGKGFAGYLYKLEVC